jgi:Animal haem peroxidase
MAVTERVDRRFGWSRLPKPAALVTLMGLRMRLRRVNLFDPAGVTLPWAPSPLPDGERPLTRSADGTGNDLTHPEMGSVGALFGRNVPPDETAPVDVLTPNPRAVSLELLTRQQFVPATTLNVLAAAWLQFEVHDWFSHGSNEPDDPWLVDLDPSDPWPQHPMQIQRTHQAAPTTDGKPPTYANTETHWWDASQVYGSSLEFQHQLRTHAGGKLLLSPEGNVPFDPSTMRELAGVNGNWWLGLAMFHTVFMREHNAICDRLARAHPDWDDDELFEHARLVNAALIAKIHTVEWTPALLDSSTMQTGMRANWWGLMGERFARRFGRVSTSEEVSGIPGSQTWLHGAPYAMTEEFVAVYRMHPLIPDDFSLRAAADNHEIASHTFPEIAGTKTHEILDTVPMADLLYSFATEHPGAIVLHNFPKHLQHFVKPDGSVVDLAAVDVLRSRERGVPRYNEFRRRFHLAPARRFEDFSDDPSVVADLRRLYDEPEDVDLMIGLYAEAPPKGFAFSDTAFRVFVLMASRRLKSDRFYTYDYRPEVYSREGLAWIADNTMATVLARNFPELAPRLQGVQNAFAPWPTAGAG